MLHKIRKIYCLVDVRIVLLYSILFFLFYACRFAVKEELLVDLIVHVVTLIYSIVFYSYIIQCYL